MSFRRVENLHDASKITLKYSEISVTRPVHLRRVVEICYYNSTRRIHFGRVVEISTIFQCYFRRVVHISDASRKTLNYSSIFPRRVENVPDASPKYATIFQCYFGRVMQICDASKITFMTPPPE